MPRNPSHWLVPFLVLLTTQLPHMSFAVERTIPPMTTADLNGRKLQVPADMAGNPAVWVVAFDRAQQRQVDRLLGLVQAAKSTVPGLAFWEVPLIEDPGTFMQWFINSGMRGGIVDTDARARVVTFYVPDRAAWLKQVGLGVADQAYAVLVSKDGMVVAVESQSKILTLEQMTSFLAKAKTGAQ
jgi:hypothetical protein